MQEINSVNNELVKETVKLQLKKYRSEKNRFLIEGSKCVKEAYDAGIEINYAFVLKSKSDKYGYLKENLIPTNEAVLKKISTTESAPEIVAVGVKKTYTADDLKQAEKIVLLENIKDMGNLGTILRTSVAFNADAVILYGKECADLYNPKCVRSATGNLWKIPVVYIENFALLQKHFSGYDRVATLVNADKFLKNFTCKKPLIVMFGSEADGLSQELINFATQKVKIEMSDKVESLNLSVSCSIILYKLFL